LKADLSATGTTRSKSSTPTTSGFRAAKTAISTSTKSCKWLGLRSEKVGVYDRVSGDDMTGREKMSWAGKMVFDVSGTGVSGDGATRVRRPRMRSRRPTRSRHRPEPRQHPVQIPVDNDRSAEPDHSIEGRRHAGRYPVRHRQREGWRTHHPAQDATIKITSALQIDISQGHHS
jgi:hypothetical protein